MQSITNEKAYKGVLLKNVSTEQIEKWSRGVGAESIPRSDRFKGSTQLRSVTLALKFNKLIK